MRHTKTNFQDFTEFHSSAMSHELTYFDLPARAEALRVVLHASGINFKDNRLSFADWPPIKPTTLLGEIPNLRIGNEVFCQSPVSNSLVCHRAVLR
jgi:hypothetical protein